MSEDQIDKLNSSFSTWHNHLKIHAESKGGSAADKEAWREDYDAGKTPEQAWFDEWGDQ